MFNKIALWVYYKFGKEITEEQVKTALVAIFILIFGLFFLFYYLFSGPSYQIPNPTPSVINPTTQ